MCIQSVEKTISQLNLTSIGFNVQTVSNGCTKIVLCSHFVTNIVVKISIAYSVEKVIVLFLLFSFIVLLLV